MLWILLSILAALVWSIVSIIDKYVLSKFFRNPTTATIVFSFVGLITSFVIFYFQKIEITLKAFGFSLLAGSFYALMTVFYFKAIKLEEVSRVIPLYYLDSLFVSIMAAIFLGETFTLVKYFGIFLLIIGAILISMKRLEIAVGKPFWFIIVATIFASFHTIILKYLLLSLDFWSVFGLIRIGTFLSLLPIIFTNFSDLISVAKKYGDKPIILLFVNESLNIVGVFLITIAASIGFITLVNALSSIQPFFVLLFATILSVFYPRILKEEVSKQTLILKLIATVMIFFGAWLVMG